MSIQLEILVTDGVLKGHRFNVTETGGRLGRSSSCEISIPDPALSRNHCLFELRDDALWVTDLASANGTFVNNAQLGSDSLRLNPGDVISVGDSSMVVVHFGEDAPKSEQRTSVTLDLGLGDEANHGTVNGDVNGDGESAHASIMRFIMWLAAIIAVAGAAMLILFDNPSMLNDTAKSLPTEEKPVLHGFTFEKVEADSNGIYRYALSLDPKGVLAVVIDDVPNENRHVQKTMQLSTNAIEEIGNILSASELYSLDREYAGVPLKAGTLKSFALRVVRGTRVFETSIENTQEPAAFKEVRERLEAFSKNELGIWAIQFSAEKLIEMSDESRRAGDAKWEERDVQHGNLAAALAAYREAVFYLETVNPKPMNYGELVAQRDKVAAELDKRYRNQRFLADRAINLSEWKVAQRELRVLCDLVPDTKDSRHAEASAKLLDVEARIKKGM